MLTPSLFFVLYSLMLCRSTWCSPMRCTGTRRTLMGGTMARRDAHAMINNATMRAKSILMVLGGKKNRIG